MGRAAKLAAMLLTTLLSATACGGSGAGSGVGETAADFSVTTIEGEEFELEEKRGEIVALYFMAAY